MRNVSMVRTGLALAAVLLVAGPGLLLAASPGPSYTPKSSILLGSTTVPKGTTANYQLQVTYTNGAVLTFPPDTTAFGATLTFTSVFGTIDSTGHYTATTTFNKDRVTGSYTQNGGQVISSLTINTP